MLKRHIWWFSPSFRFRICVFVAVYINPFFPPCTLVVYSFMEFSIRLRKGGKKKNLFILGKRKRKYYNFIFFPLRVFILFVGWEIKYREGGGKENFLQSAIFLKQYYDDIGSHVISDYQIFFAAAILYRGRFSFLVT